MIYEAYVLNRREDPLIHRDVNRVGTWVGSNGMIDMSLKDFVNSLSAHRDVGNNNRIIVYATKYVKLSLNNDKDDEQVVVTYRHPVYVGTVGNYKDNNNLIDEIRSLSIVC